MKKSNKRRINGFLLIDKPHGVSSNHALQKVKRMFNAYKAGHNGTLDPAATGLLPISFGEATKFSQFILESDKSYEVQAKLGVQTETGDAEGKVLKVSDFIPNQKEFEKKVLDFKGFITQIPPMYSAVKHKGQPLYKLAREGKLVDRKERSVNIYELTVKNWSLPYVDMFVKCSKGTYIRTLIEDIATSLATCAYVTSLRRVAAGPFSNNQAYTFEMLESILEKDGFEGLDKLLLPIESGIEHLAAISLSDKQAECIKHGKTIDFSDKTIDGIVRIHENKQLIGIGYADAETNKLTPKRLVSQELA